MTTTALAIDFIDIDVRDLPILWEDMFRQAVNDYISRDESDEIYCNAEKWLFYEEFNMELDGRDCLDVCSLYVVGEAFSLDLEKMRFDVQCMKDTIAGRKCDFKGRKGRQLSHSQFGNLIDRWKRKKT